MENIIRQYLLKSSISIFAFLLLSSGLFYAQSVTIKVPINQLKRFQRITLAPGESKTLSFEIRASEFSFYDNAANDLKIQPGEWDIHVGSSSKDIRSKNSFIIE